MFDESSVTSFESMRSLSVVGSTTRADPGSSKYGIARTFEVILDMFTTEVVTWFRERPMQWFTAMGISFFAAALLASLAVFWEGSKAVVPATMALLAATSFLACLLSGRLAEFVLATAGPGARPLANEFGEQP
jgi:hypothetical protein